MQVRKMKSCLVSVNKGSFTIIAGYLDFVPIERKFGNKPAKNRRDAVGTNSYMQD